ncbi:hypothetical protein CBS147372_8250 [Penicillium roqueforti]|nr:hypothetical protein CBS147372_8250 [Penicillium roqueforti]
MHFTAPSVALLALAAGVQAGSKQLQEPPVHVKGIIGKQRVEPGTDVAPTGAQTGTHPIGTGIVGTGTSTGSHPIVTGTPGGPGGGVGNNSTIIVTGTSPCYTCHGSATIPVYVPTRTQGTSPSGGAGSGTGSGSGSDSGSGIEGSGSGSVGSGGVNGSGSTSGAGKGASPSSPVSTSGSDSTNDYSLSSPGSKVTAPQIGVVSAVIGSMVYGTIMLLA